MGKRVCKLNFLTLARTLFHDAQSIYNPDTISAHPQTKDVSKQLCTTRDKNASSSQEEQDLVAVDNLSTTHTTKDISDKKLTNNGSLDTTTGVIWKQLITLCYPVFLSSFFQQLQLLCNAWVVGKFAGTNAFAALQSCGALCDLVISFSLGLGVGCGVIVSQYFGAKDYKRVHDGVHTAMGLAVVCGIVFSVIGTIFAQTILEMMDTPQEIIGDTLNFVHIFMASMIFSIIYNIGSALQRAVGDTKTPSIIVASTCVVNALLDILFVAGFGLGTLGCGVATLISLIWGSALTLYKLTHTNGCWALVVHDITINPAIAAKMLKCGFPLAIQGSMFGLSNIIVQSSVNMFGPHAIAAWGLSCRMTCFVWMLSEAIGSSVTTFAAQNFGARNYKRMQRGLYTAMVLALIIIGSFTVIVMTFAHPFARVFVSDETVIAITLMILMFNTPFSIFYTIMDIFSGTIRGSGESMGPMIITIIGTCILRVAWIMILMPIHPTLETILVGYPVSWVATAAFFALYYYKGHWMQHGSTKLKQLRA